MTYFNETVRLTKKYIEQLKVNGVSRIIVSQKGENMLNKATNGSPSGAKIRLSGKKIKISAVGNTSAELEKIASRVRVCKECHLHKTRKNAVPGEGSPKAKLMFIGEGPGFDEDRLGRPFVGRSGQLLDKIISAMGLKREDVFIANIVKCHPMIDPSNPDKRGNDRKPAPEEINACIHYIESQIKLINPKIICSLGSVSATTLTGIAAPLGQLRGRFQDYRGIKLMPTFHPAALLRNPNWKKDAWEDMKKIMKELK